MEHGDDVRNHGARWGKAAGAEECGSSRNPTKAILEDCSGRRRHCDVRFEKTTRQT
jgi:hypothetical protein